MKSNTSAWRDVALKSLDSATVNGPSWLSNAEAIPIIKKVMMPIVFFMFFFRSFTLSTDFPGLDTEVTNSFVLSPSFFLLD